MSYQALLRKIKKRRLIRLRIAANEKAIADFRKNSCEPPLCEEEWPSHLEPPTEEDIAFLAELNNRE